jgi:hypothetical protein
LIKHASSVWKATQKLRPSDVRVERYSTCTITMNILNYYMQLLPRIAPGGRRGKGTNSSGGNQRSVGNIIKDECKTECEEEDTVLGSTTTQPHAI